MDAVLDPVDSHDGAEPARPPRLHPGEGVLEHRAEPGGDVERRRAGQERVGLGLARELAPAGDHPVDPGGATNLGITAATLARARGRPVSAADVAALTRAEAAAIYRLSATTCRPVSTTPSSTSL